MTHAEKREIVANIIARAKWGSLHPELGEPNDVPGGVDEQDYRAADAILALPPATSEIGADMVLVPRKWNQEMYAVYHGRQDYAQPGMALCISDWWPHFILAASPSAVSAAPTPQAGDGWRPIETAPRNGEIVLIWTPETHTYVTMGRYWIQDEAWADEEGEQAFPTHWRPRPEPPAEPDTSGYAEWADEGEKGDGA